VPGTLEAIRRLASRKIPVIIVSNQSGVARGILSKKQLDSINRKMLHAIRQAGGKIRKVYYCTHHPEKNCSCRKPRTGMLLKAAFRFGIDLKKSYLVGDSETDILMARSAGCRNALVLSGRHTRASAKHLSVQPDRVWKDLRAAVRWILQDSAR